MVFPKNKKNHYFSMPMKTTCFFLFFFFFFFSPLLAQTLEIHSISYSRQIGGQVGYTLDGIWMENSRLKLLNPENFSASGTYPKTISIIDAYKTSGSMTEVGNLPKNSIFFMGSFDLNDPTLEAFTSEEIDTLYNWSLRGGKMIITSGLILSSFTNYNSSYLNSKWGYISGSATSNITPTFDGNQTELFDGPFGKVSGLKQGGALQGFFYKTPSDIKILGRASNGLPAIYLDCKTLDLMVVDVDVFTNLSMESITLGNKIQNDQDRFLANSIAFMDKLQSPPIMIKTNNELSVSSDYLGYQWYFNDEAIPNANGPSYEIGANGSGNYYVEVTLNGGCVLKSNQFNPECEAYVPTAFSPDGNGVNDFACAYSNCIKDLEFKIFDRWGELIFQSNDASKCWDGTYQGVNANNGVYAWTIIGTRQSGSKLIQKGNISLIR